MNTPTTETAIAVARPSPIGRDEVFRACDALMCAGIRPTGESVRSHLGRGSPNTIHPLITEWWRTLSQRIARDEHRPDVPDAVWQSANSLWDMALVAATDAAEKAMQARLQVVLTREEHAERRVAEAMSVRESAESRVSEMQRMLDAAVDRSDRVVAECTEAQSSLRASIARVETLDRELTDAKRMLTAIRADHDVERERADQRHAADRAAWAKEKEDLRDAAERDRDRIMRDLDAARQATKDVQRKFDDLDRQFRDASAAHAARVLDLTSRAETADTRHATVLREMARITADLDAFRATSQSVASVADQLRTERDQLRGQVDALNAQCTDLLTRVVVDADETSALHAFRSMSLSARARWLQQRRP